MTYSNPYPSYPECVAKVLSASPEPVTLETLLAGIETYRPLGKTARATTMRAVESLFQAVPLAEGRFGWLTNLITGCTIRHSLEAEEIKDGAIYLDELEHALFFPQFFQKHRPDERSITLDLFGGDPVHVVASADNGVWTLQPGAEYRAWLEEAGAAPNDDLIIHVMDGSEARYSVRLQPRARRDEDTIDAHNRRLVVLAEQIAVERLSRSPSLFTWNLVARLIAGGAYNDPIPPDDLHYVLDEYSLLGIAEGDYYSLQLKRSRRQPGSPPRKGALTRGRATRKRDNDAAARASGRGALQNFLSGDAMSEQTQGGGFNQEGEDTCDAYEEYLESLMASGRKGKPLGHDDFHLLEAELESLVDLELEFGYLLPDQTQRKEALADRLFIDPETLVDGGWDDDDDLDAPSPGLWN